MVMVIVMMVVGGCGDNTTTATGEAVSSAETNNSTFNDAQNTEEATTATTETKETAESVNADAQIVNDKDSLNLEEYVSTYEDRSVEKEGESVFDFDDFELRYEQFYLLDTVDIYAWNGRCIGYIKSGTAITTIGQNDEWYYINIEKNYRFLKASDILEAGFAGTKKDYLASLAPKEEVTNTPKPASGNQTSVPIVPPTEASVPTEELPVEPAVPVESDKYTPEEAIAVYRSLMEEGGITWEPSLKGVTSWGTGWIYLEKGMPEWAAESNLESYAMGDSAGNPWTEYYLEVTGSDENAVYITAWHN